MASRRITRNINIIGYRKVGKELLEGSKLYQYISDDTRINTTIVLRETKTGLKVFKGRVDKDKTYIVEKLTEQERSELIKQVGELEEVDLVTIVSDTKLEESYKDFIERKAGE